jgi:hypothetical protein
MKASAQWFLLVALFSPAHLVQAQATTDDPAMARVLREPAELHAGAQRPVPDLTVSANSMEDPPEIELRRSLGWIRGGSTIAVISWGTLLTWAVIARPKHFEEGSCGGGTATPYVLAAPLVISTVLTVLGVVRKRALEREGVHAYPVGAGRRTLRILGISAGAAALVAAGGAALAFDTMCFT